MTAPFTRAVQTVKSGFAVLGFVATVAGVVEYQRLVSTDQNAKKKTKNLALVIPFHRLQIVEWNERDLRGRVAELISSSDGPNVDTTMEVRELVDVLHHAASDPNITSIYGIFGHGGQGIEETGWAQLEEIRNALQVVKESHRRHPEPNTTHNAGLTSPLLSSTGLTSPLLQSAGLTSPLVPSKPLYAYTDSFTTTTSPLNRNYYLASVFTHIHMQQKGEVTLFGAIAEQFFFRGLLEKYGIQVNVFKHGPYKNFPNIFTHMAYSKHHYENVANLQKSIEADVCNEITVSRFDKLQTSWLTKKYKRDDNTTMWKRIYATGAFPGVSAIIAGFVDSLPRRDPLSDLVDRKKSNNDDCVRKVGLNPHETDFSKFPSDSTISLKQYTKQIASKKRVAQRKRYMEGYIEKSPYLKQFLSLVGSAKINGVEQIALLHVDGVIGYGTADKLVDSIRKIRMDDKTKCVVVRISSGGGSVVACETIQQELKSLDIPIVFSFGNASASGGYYIASCADRIFCSKKTITGSIGVFGIRPDLTGLAAKYGINVDHIASGELAGIYSSFLPMSLKMKKHFAKTVDRHYSDFKSIVCDGRHIPVDKIEAIAQGRVWTGLQAKEIGLIDEMGGLHRAIAYARRTYTSNKFTDGTDVVEWPRKKTFTQKLMDRGTRGSSIPSASSGFYMVANEGTAIQCLVEDAKVNVLDELHTKINPSDGLFNFHKSFWQ